MLPVAVVGAGVVGVACARTLQQAGRRVVLFDPAPPGAQCSFGNAGHIALDHIRPLARPDVLAGVPRMLTAPLGPLVLRWRGVPALAPWLGRFAAAATPGQVRAGTEALAGLLGSALADWEGLLAGAGLQGMLRQEGALAIMETRRGVEAGRVEAQTLAAHGVAFEELSGAEVLALAPGLAATPAGGRLFRQAAHVVHPFRLVQALAERFVADGGTLISEGVRGFRLEGGRVAGVEVGAGVFEVADVVVTAGLGSGSLVRAMGVHLPLTAERGYHAMLPLGALDVRLPITFNERGFVVTPMEHGIRLAGTVELGAGGQAPDWARADILAEHVRGLFGRAVTPLERWQGDRPTLPDYLPALGRAPGLANVVVAAGHQHLGLTLAAVSARVVGCLLGDRPTGLDIGPFNPGRFSKSRLEFENGS